MTIKENIFKNGIIKDFLFKQEKHFFAALVEYFPEIANKYRYKRMTGKKLNIKNPQEFNEKLQWLNLYLYRQHPLVIKCSDKYEIRKYVTDCGYGELLNELYGMYNTTAEIDWDKLPSKFALKCTHGSGFNVICDDKGKLDKNDIFRKLNKWLKTDYSLVAGEFHYANIKPRIICERYIETDAGLFPVDYKLYCFNGKVYCTEAITLRNTGYPIVCFYDRAWENKLPYLKDTYLKDDYLKDLFHKCKVEKPISYDKMVEVAERLSKPFPFVRVDFYDFNGTAIIGEMTFTPNSCTNPYYTNEASRALGELITLPNSLK